MNILAIGTYPNDIELSCGGVDLEKQVGGIYGLEY
jgi:hypothetical protein